MAKLTLIQLKQGEKGKVVKFNGGRNLINKLTSRGLRPGKKIKKISESFMGGPVTIEVDNARLALGRGMATKVIVETGREEL
ncbi:MAG: FeoA family protein [Bacillota bacterium]